MSRIIQLIALALAAAAVAAPMAQGVQDPNGRQALDPLALSYLQGQGFSPGEIKVLVGQGDPLAVSYLREPRLPADASGDPGDSRRRSTRWPSATCGTRASHPARSRVLVGQGDPLALSYAAQPRLPAGADPDRRHICRFQLVGRRHRRRRHARPRAAAGGRGRRARDHPPEPQAARRQRLNPRSSGRPPTRRRDGPLSGARLVSGPGYFERGMKLIAPDVSSTAHRTSEIESISFSRA